MTQLPAAYPRLAKAFLAAPEHFPRHLVASHPRVAKQLDTVWGRADGLRYLDELLFSDRPDRHGFDFGVMTELFALKNLHEKLYPQPSVSRHDAYANVTSGWGDEPAWRASVALGWPCRRASRCR